MKRYLYKNISTYHAMGGWCADYVDVLERKSFALHRACCQTKRAAYEDAKCQVDYLNRKEREQK
jgi:hypothetical protein